MQVVASGAFLCINIVNIKRQPFLAHAVICRCSQLLVCVPSGDRAGQPKWSNGSTKHHFSHPTHPSLTLGCCRWHLCTACPSTPTCISALYFLFHWHFSHDTICRSTRSPPWLEVASNMDLRRTIREARPPRSTTEAGASTSTIFRPRSRQLVLSR